MSWSLVTCLHSFLTFSQRCRQVHSKNLIFKQFAFKADKDKCLNLFCIYIYYSRFHLKIPGNMRCLSYQIRFSPFSNKKPIYNFLKTLTGWKVLMIHTRSSKLYRIQFRGSNVLKYTKSFKISWTQEMIQH